MLVWGCELEFYRGTLYSVGIIYHFEVPTLKNQGSEHYAPEHCLVNGGFPYFGGKSHVLNGQNVSFKEPWKSPGQNLPLSGGRRLRRPPPSSGLALVARKRARVSRSGHAEAGPL